MKKNVENIYNGKFEYPDGWDSVSDIQVILSTSIVSIDYQ